MNGLLDQLTAQARLEHVVDLAHRKLQLDAVYVSEVRDGRQVYRAVAGDADSFNIVLDDGLPIEDTYGQRMLAGEIPNLIPDASADERVAELTVTRVNRIGAYVGVPIRCPAGTVYGVLACVSHAPRPTLDDRAVRLLEPLGELIAFDLQDQSRRHEVRDTILGFIEAGNFAVAYQPIVDLGSGRWLGLEALARFPQPFARPDETFAAAGEVGLGLGLERAAARRACEIVPSLAAGQFLAVNVSPAAVLDLARRAGTGEEFPLSKIVVEVTEHSAIQAYAALSDQLAPLRKQGLRIAVDDAGAGYASLRHILELRPDFIKLDRWLIDGLADDRGRRVAVSAFVSLARELGSSVIAEGIERAEDLAVARDLGLDGAQGYLLGRPSVDHDQIAAWCRSGTGGRASAGAREAITGTGGHDLALAGGSRSGPTVAGPRGAMARELERFELDRRVSQRLEAVGQLAAGIAHEINTPLQFVGDSVTFLSDAVDELVKLTSLYRQTLYAEAPVPVEERRRAMRAAEEEADVEYLCERIPAAFERTVEGIARVRSIVQAMKRFSHASGAESTPADINEALETTLAVCRNEYKYVAHVNLDLGELPAVVCNIGELNQVFLNLIINAAHAIEEKSGATPTLGHISISTRVDGEQVVIAIADDGAGIAPALRERIYEPFFTTKAVGKGTGQGLALALAIIQRHGGSLDCVSTPGEGTTFSIRLPLQSSALETDLAA